jgi:hypothetical protein
MDKVTLLAWKFRGALIPAGDSSPFIPVGPVSVGELLLQGTMVAVAEVELLQKGAPEGPPSPYP